ncbi:MAG: glycine cleavage system protein GcvH [Bacteroidales bacterium]|nr:glycine cleavage system protein GcvH [Bacteroidales bacterium]MBN2764239.1 glycine cleavage system protein GcvH [Bacteroidales bacterium]
MTIPDNLKYTKDHEWIRPEGTMAVVGITDFAQGELGDIVFVEIETLGENLEKEATFGTIEAVKTVSDLFMPVSGKVVEINEAINDSPELVNKDPYGNGWLIKIEMDSPDQLNELFDAKGYEKLVSA